MTPSDPHRAAGWVAACFSLSAFCAAALAVVWWRDGPVYLGGVFLAGSLGLLSAGLATWANRMTPPGPFSEERDLPPRDDVSDAAAEDLITGSQLPRRGLVTTTLAGAVVAVGAALVVPFGALGPRPGDALHRTGWARGREVVDGDGMAVRAADVPVGGIVTVFPAGHVGSADGQVLLVRVDPDLLELAEGRETWTVDGLVGYSQVCTHAGCPVSLYSPETHEALCPCHQSSFNVLRGARPTHGPAVWPLPQLPLRVDDRGFLVADGPLSAPVGPGWWRSEGS